MKFDYEGMLTEILSGTDPAEIAEQFTKDLNNAISTAKKFGPYDTAVKNFTQAWNDLMDAYVVCHGDPGFDIDAMKISSDDVEHFVPTIMKIGKLAEDYCNILNITKHDEETEPDFDELVADFLNQ